MSVPSFSIVNLGCKVNRAESDAVAAALIAAGGRPVDEAQADFIVVNTCTVTGEADKKARKAVRRALKANEHARVVVTGCAAALDPASFAALDPRIEVVARNDLADLAGTAQAPVDSLPIGDGFRTRVSVKVQDGCDRACTYCIVHVARGRATSVPVADVRARVTALARAGVKETVLTGINLGSYSSEGLSLAGLLKALLEDTYAVANAHPPRLRISSIEPFDLDDDLVDLLASSGGRICRHLHLPLQSGSTRVLEQMARGYTAEDFASLVGRLYKRVPALSLSTDIIVGFPGETDEDFERTLDAARSCRFSRIHVFPYSKRAGTPAAERADYVPDEVKRARAATLRALGAQLRAEDYARRVGSVEDVLVDERTALTESYHEVAAPLLSHPGDLVPLVLQPKS